MFACKESDLVLEKHVNCASRFGRGYPCFAIYDLSQQCFDISTSTIDY